MAPTSGGADLHGGRDATGRRPGLRAPAALGPRGPGHLRIRDARCALNGGGEVHGLKFSERTEGELLNSHQVSQLKRNRRSTHR